MMLNNENSQFSLFKVICVMIVLKLSLLMCNEIDLEMN